MRSKTPHYKPPLPYSYGTWRGFPPVKRALYTLNNWRGSHRQPS